jgi:hypothetical protein
LSFQDLGHGVATDLELNGKLVDGAAGLIRTHQVINLVLPEATVDLPGGSRFGRYGSVLRGCENSGHAFSLVSVV